MNRSMATSSSLLVSSLGKFSLIFRLWACKTVAKRALPQEAARPAGRVAEQRNLRSLCASVASLAVFAESSPPVLGSPADSAALSSLHAFPQDICHPRLRPGSGAPSDHAWICRSRRSFSHCQLDASFTCQDFWKNRRAQRNPLLFGPRHSDSCLWSATNPSSQPGKPRTTFALKKTPSAWSQYSLIPLTVVASDAQTFGEVQ